MKNAGSGNTRRRDGPEASNRKMTILAGKELNSKMLAFWEN